LIWLSWIWVRNGNADPDPRARNRSKLNKFIVQPLKMIKNISESLKTSFRLKYFGTGIFLTLDPGWKNSDPA
jgi:hypothetical protein